MERNVKLGIEGIPSFLDQSRMTAVLSGASFSSSSSITTKSLKSEGFFPVIRFTSFAWVSVQDGHGALRGHLFFEFLDQSQFIQIQRLSFRHFLSCSLD